jgi:hypothetical protein
MTAGHPDTHPDTTDSRPDNRTPGVRYRRRTETRLVPVTRDGRTHHIERRVTVYEALPPRDVDLIVRRAALTVAAALLVGAVVWSTASIGALLSTVTHPAAAYGAAAVFDAAWITCLALEWLARYDADRVRGPRTAGYLALVVAMAAITTHGYVEASLWVGLIGASASALAKLCWTLVMRHHTHVLDPETAAWLEAERSEIAAGLVTAGLRRDAARAEAQQRALRTALGLPDAQADNPADTADNGPDVSGHADATVRAAVRAASATLPDATPEAIAAHLSGLGIAADPDTVRDVLQQAETPKDDIVHRIQPRIADTVRTAVATGKTDLPDVLAYVRKVHGQDIREDTVARTLRRIA